MIDGRSSFRALEKIAHGKVDFSTVNMKLLLILSLTVVTSAIPVAMILLMYITYTACFVITTTWSVSVIFCMYTGYLKPDVCAKRTG